MQAPDYVRLDGAVSASEQNTVDVTTAVVDFESGLFCGEQ
jgi:hypothetical protein